MRRVLSRDAEREATRELGGVGDQVQARVVLATALQRGEVEGVVIEAEERLRLTDGQARELDERALEEDRATVVRVGRVQLPARVDVGAEGAVRVW
jgi:hypothetical protein